MYYRFTRRFNYLNVADTFARLRDVARDGSLTFQFKYSVSQRDAVKSNALTVKVSVLSRTIKAPSVLSSPLGNIDARSLVRNVVSQVADAKSAAQKQLTYVVASRNSDVTSAISNTAITQLTRGGTKNNIQQMSQPRLTLQPASALKQANVTKPILTFAASQSPISSSASTTDAKSLMNTMVNVQGQDPSTVLSQATRSTSAVSSVGGSAKVIKAQEFASSVTSQLHDFYVFHPSAPMIPETTDDVVDSEVIHVLTNEASDTADLSLDIVIPGTLLSSMGASTQFQVKFDMIEGVSGVTIDTVSKPLDVAKHLQFYNTPRVAPIVSVAKSAISSRCNLEIKQLDKAASGVNVYKKVFWSSVPGVDDYTLIGSYGVTSSQQSLLVQVDKPVSSVAIYRVVPVGPHGTLGSEYTNVVVKPTASRVMVKSVALVASLVSNGVQVEVRKIPTSVVALSFMRRNVTQNQVDYETIGDDVAFIDDATRRLDHVSYVDSTVAINNVYEYVVKLCYDTGDAAAAGYAMLEVTSHDVAAASTAISALVVTHGTNPDVSFSIATSIINTSADVVKTLLQRQDLYDQFKDDITKEREFLTSLIAHNVQRVNVSTGQREDFGTIPTSDFSDSSLRQNKSVTPLQYGNHYRYEVQPLLRAPETMFQTLTKTVTDQSTRKPYTFSPAKFMHPITLTKGIISSQTGLKQLYSKQAMEWGALGAPQVVEVSFDEAPARIVDAAVSRFNDATNTLTWKVQGELTRIDHFIVAMQVNSVRTLIGKAHGIVNGNTVQYLHDLTSSDIGQLSYVITPIFDDYTVGDETQTNAVNISEVVL